MIWWSKCDCGDQKFKGHMQTIASSAGRLFRHDKACGLSKICEDMLDFHSQIWIYTDFFSIVDLLGVNQFAANVNFRLNSILSCTYTPLDVLFTLTRRVVWYETIPSTRSYPTVRRSLYILHSRSSKNHRVSRVISRDVTPGPGTPPKTRSTTRSLRR